MQKSFSCLLSESAVALYVGLPQKQNGNQYDAMESDHCKTHQ